MTATLRCRPSRQPAALHGCLAGAQLGTRHALHRTPFSAKLWAAYPHPANLASACMPVCLPSLPCSAMNGAQSAAFGTYAALTWLGRRAEMAAASWLKNTLEDTSSGEWVGRGGLLAGGVVGDAAGSAADGRSDGRSVRQWRVAARVGRGRLGPSSSCCVCVLLLLQTRTACAPLPPPRWAPCAAPSCASMPRWGSFFLLGLFVHQHVYTATVSCPCSI